MSYNYYVIPDFLKSRRGAQKEGGSGGGSARGWNFARSVVSKVFLLLLFFGGVGAKAQTILINQTQEGGFESGATFAANGWTVVNGDTNKWYAGSNGTVTAFDGSRMAYVSNDNGATNGYNVTSASGFSRYSYFYRDVVVPEGQNRLQLSFQWKNAGEASKDGLMVFLAPTSYTPTADAAINATVPGILDVLSGATVTTSPTILAGKTTYQYSVSNIPASFVGSSVRLIFGWVNDKSGGTASPSASVDDISLLASTPRVFTTARSGNLSNPNTWIGQELPGVGDDVVIAAGHNVLIDATTLRCNNMTVNGTVTFATTSSQYLYVDGNLLVNSGGTLNINDGLNKCQNLFVSGDIVNNGTIDITKGTSGGMNLIGSKLQTVSGSGSFGNFILGLWVANTSTAIPNVKWLIKDTVINNVLSLLSGRIDLAGGKMTYTGTSSNLVVSVGQGFVSGSKFSRIFAQGTGSTGTSISANTYPNTNNGLYPFVSSTGDNRWAYLGRSNGGSAMDANEISAVYNDDPTFATGLNISDPSLPGTIIDSKLKSSWKFKNETGTTSYIYSLALAPQNGIVPSNGNAVVMLSDSALPSPSSHESGTFGTKDVSVHRISMTESQLTGAPLYVGLKKADSYVYPVKDGEWGVDDTWSTGSVPISTDLVFVTKYAVDLNVPASCKNVMIDRTGTLNINEGAVLTVGKTLNNNSFIINGTCVMNGGTLKVNGNFLQSFQSNGLAINSTFIQNGGDIIVDGNSGTAETSVPTNTPICAFLCTGPANLKLNAGTITIVNPHFSNAAIDYALQFGSNSSADQYPSRAGIGHKVFFGNGVSSVPGSSNGFYITSGNGGTGSRNFLINDMVVNTSNANNRFVKVNTVNSQFVIGGNLTVNAGGEFKVTPKLIIAGNIVNNGTISFGGVASSSSVFGELATGLYVGPSVVPSPNAQMISGTGVFNCSHPTLGGENQIGSFTINNSSAQGVTLNIPLTMAGTLTLTNGKLNTTDTNILTMGTALTAGAISPSSPTSASYINGPMQRYVAAGSSNKNYLAFPVGTSNSFGPIAIAPSTAVSTSAIIKATAFDTNAGTAGAGVTGLSATRRWEMPVVSGSIVDANVKIGDCSIITATSGVYPVMATTAGGTYNTTLGTSSLITTGTAGTPCTPGYAATKAAVTSANYSPYISLATSTSCSGTPTAGTVTASANTSMCAGQMVTLSLSGAAATNGITYQWQSSVDGTTFSSISGATEPTYAARLGSFKAYNCKVTCGASNATTPALTVGFANSSVSPAALATQCGPGNLTLSTSTTIPGGTTLVWYPSTSLYADGSYGLPTVGGLPVGTGNNLSVSIAGVKNTDYTYYAALETVNAGQSTATVLPTSISGSKTAGTFYPMFVSAISASTINTIDFVPAEAGTFTFTLNGPSGKDNKTSGTQVLATKTITVTAEQVVSGNTITVPVSFSVPANAVGYSVNCDKKVMFSSASNAYVYPYVLGDFSVTGIGGDANGGGKGYGYGIGYGNDTTSKIYSWNWSVTTSKIVCSGQRMKTTEKNTTTLPTLTLDKSLVTVCKTDDPSVPLNVSLKNVLPTAFNTYTWSPSTGVSGDAVNGWTFDKAIANGTVYTLTAKITGGCSNSATVTFVNKPTTDTVPSTQYIINDTAALASALIPAPCASSCSAGFVQWYDAPAGGTAINATDALISNKTYYVAMADDFCETLRVPATVIINSSATAAPTVVSPYGICPGAGKTLADVTVTTLPGATLSWYADGTTKTPVYPNTVPSVGTTYYVTQAVNNVESAMVPVVFTDFSPVPTGAATQVVCQSGNLKSLQAIALGGANGKIQGTVNWYENPVGGSPLSLDNTTLENNKHYYAEQVNGSCVSSARLDVAVSINPNVLSPTFTQLAPICQGASVTLPTVSNNGIAGVWTPEFDNMNNGVYTFTSYSNKCGSNVTMSITVNSVVAPTAVAQTFCIGAKVSDLKANGNAGATFNWYMSSTGGKALTSSTVLSTATYYASQIVAGCESIDRIPVAVTIKTTPPTAAAQSFCNAATIGNVVVSGVNGATFKFYSAFEGGDLLTTNTPLATGNNDLYVSQVEPVSVCESLRTFVQVTVNAIPAAPTGQAVQTFCGSATVASLKAVGTTPGAVFKWYTAATGGTLWQSSDVLVSGHYFGAQVINGCESTNRLDVTVNTGVVQTPTFDQVPAICHGKTFTLPVISKEGVLGTWSPAPVTTNTTSLPVSTQYTFTPGTAGCSTPATMNVTVNPLPATLTSTTVKTPQAFCEAATLAELLPVSTATVTYNWYQAANGGSPILLTDPLKSSNTFYVTQVDVNGCESARFSMNTTVTTKGPTAADQNFCSSVFASKKVSDLVPAPSATVKWYSAETGGQALASTASLEPNIYYAAAVVTKNDASTCEVALRTKVIVGSLNPAAPTGNAVQKYCNSAKTINLTTTSTGTVKWYSQLSGGSEYTGALTDNQKYYASQTVATCESTDRLEVTVSNLSPTPTANPAQTFCMGDTVAKLSTNSTGTVNWYDAATGGNLLDLSTVLVDQKHYFASQILSACESAGRVEVVATVNALPATPTASVTDPNCTVHTGSVMVTSSTNDMLFKIDGGDYGLSLNFNDLSKDSDHSVFAKSVITGCQSLPLTVHVGSGPILAGTPEVAVTQPSCKVLTGSAKIQVVAGETYSLDNGPFTSTTLVYGNLAPGSTHMVKGKSVDGCISEQAFEFTLLSQPTYPDAPIINAVAQPTCGEKGKVELTGLPADNWTIKQSGTVTKFITGSGSTATISGLAQGFYLFTVTNAGGCLSDTSEFVQIEAQPASPQALFVVSTTQPTCATLGSVLLNNLPSGNWTIHQTGMASKDISGTGTEYVVSDLEPGNYVFTVVNQIGCSSTAVEAHINNKPTVPSAPIVFGSPIQPSCNTFGSVELRGLPSGSYVVTRYDADNNTYSYPEASGAAFVATGLNKGTYTFKVTSSGDCSSVASESVEISGSNPTPAPVVASPQTHGPTATISSIVVTGTEVKWYASSEDALTGSNALEANKPLEDGALYYAMQTIDGCRSMEPAEVYIMISLSVDQYEQSKLKVYPNPVADVLNLTHIEKMSSIQMFNVLGQRVMSVRPEATSVKIDMSTLPIGTYLLQIEVNGKTTMAKVVKNQ